MNKYNLELQYKLKTIIQSYQPKITERIGGNRYSRELDVQVRGKRITIPMISSEVAAVRVGSFQ